jgi:hypothetical protein
MAQPLHNRSVIAGCNIDTRNVNTAISTICPLSPFCKLIVELFPTLLVTSEMVKKAVVVFFKATDLPASAATIISFLQTGLPGTCPSRAELSEEEEGVGGA